MADFDEVSQEIATQDSVKDFVNRIGDGKVQTKKAFGIYILAIKSILKWCDTSKPLLAQMINHDGCKSQAQRSALTTALNDGIEKMTTTRNEIGNSIPNFNYVIGDIDNVEIRIAADFDNKTIAFKEEHREFYEHLDDKVQHLSDDISDLKFQLKFEVRIIDILRVQTELAEDYLSFDDDPKLHDDFHDIILEYIENLSAECNRYHKRHE